jgi:hexosaminidase
MKIEFTGDISALSEGIRYIMDDLDMELSAGGFTVEAVKGWEDSLELHKDGHEVKITYSKPVHFFRALSLLKENEYASNLYINEHQQFDTCGAMFDVSQGNAVIKLDSLKKLIRKMALMGFDMIMVYTEDSYAIEGEPYFGYMRGKYSQEELKAVDDYA